MLHEYSKLEFLIGEKMVNELARARVAIFGVGGVGACAAEALARCGVGVITLVDFATVDISDINRQTTAFHSTIGRPKTQVMKERIADIDPDILVHTYETSFSLETQRLFDFHSYDYVIDTMNSVPSKLLLIKKAKEAKVDMISCMGMENHLNPARLEITDIAKTRICPMAKVLRTALQKEKIRNVKVLYSREFPFHLGKKENRKNGSKEKGGKGKESPIVRNAAAPAPPGSISFLYGAAGMMIASEAVQDLMKMKKKR